MYTHKHTKLCLHLYTKKKQRYVKRTPLPSQCAYKYYTEIISATVKQLFIHYSNNVGLILFLSDFFKFISPSVDAPPVTWELCYIFELSTVCTIF